MSTVAYDLGMDINPIVVGEISILVERLPDGRVELDFSDGYELLGGDITASELLYVSVELKNIAIRIAEKNKHG